MGRRSGVLCGVLLLLTFSTEVAVQQSEGDGRSFPGKDWPLVGGDWTSARYSTLDQINTSNVKTLGGAWNKRLGGSTRATPVVRNGLLVLPTGESVVALNAKTGDTVWTWRIAKPADGAPEGRAQASFMESIAGETLPNVAGAAVGEGLVFVGLGGGQVGAV